MITLNDLLRPGRRAGESFAEYRSRRALGNRAVEAALRGSRPAQCSRDGKSYVVGPHRSHVGKFVTALAVVFGPTGIPEERVLRVMHPGTLMKERP